MNLTNDNYTLYASKYYLNVWASDEEFQHDLKKIRYVKKLITRYKNDEILQLRLLLNHITVLYNCFGPNASNLLLINFDVEDWKLVKPFLLFINIMPDAFMINGIRYHNDMISMDQNIVHGLRDLRKTGS